MALIDRQGRRLMAAVAGVWLGLAAGAAALEPRINEFVADNKNGLSDEDGDEVDWVEIFNPNPVALDLAGWALSDTEALPGKWVFPAVSVNARGYLIVFASGKDRRVPGSSLHTNFSLRAAGEQLLLVKPDGVTVAGQYNFGPQVQDVSFGVTAVTAGNETLIGARAPGRALVPAGPAAGTTWMQPGFDDSTWQAGLMDAGYENSTGYENLIGLNVRPAMNGIRTSCYLRIGFPAVAAGDALGLTLRMRYDDGFAVYLNGQPLPTAWRNAPGLPAWDSMATADHDDAEAVQYEEINISQHLPLLNAAGPNVLAVHGLNSSLSSSDFLIGPQLVLSRGTLSDGFMIAPSPGAANTTGVQGFVADTSFSVDRGFHNAPLAVAITCATPGAVIRYTRNGDAPTATTGFVYSTPVVVSGTTLLRAAAFRNGWQPSNVDTHSYFFLDDVVMQSADGSAPPGWPAGSVNGQRLDYGMDPAVLALTTPAVMKQALLAIPSVSLVTDQSNLTDAATGIYVSPQSRGEEAERPVSVEILNDPFHPGTKGFQQNSGLRIRGGFSRDPNNPKHSFRLFFRKAYGRGKMNYPLFGGGSPSAFDGMDLRTSQDASWAYLGSAENTFLRDEASRATQVAMMPGSRVRYVHLFLNGQYWGLYNTDERPNAGYGEQYFGGDEADYDTVKSSGYPGGHATEATDGTMAPGSGWHQLWTGARAVRANPSNSNYFKLMGRAADGATLTNDPVVLDAENLADYLMILFYMGGNDGPVSDYVGASNNWFGLRDRTGTAGFQFFIHDFEQSLGLEAGNNQRVGRGTSLRPWSDTVSGVNDYPRSNPEFIHEDLAWNAEYRVLFGDRAHRHLFNDGALTNAAVLARMQGLAAVIDTAIHGEAARWGDASQAEPFVRQDWLAANQRLYGFISSGTTASGGPGRVAEMLRQLRGYDGGAKPLYPLVNAPVFSQHGGGIPATGSAVSITQSNTGAPVLYFTLNGGDPRAVGGGVSPAALTYSGPVALSGWTTTLRARVLRGTEWSALNEAVYTRSAALPPLVVTEIHFAPAGPDGAEILAGFTDKDDFEFIEIMNTGGEPLNLRDIRGTWGLAFTLKDGILEPGGRAVVVHRLAAFRQRYGAAPRVVGTFTGSLDDGGERLALTAASGAVLTDFRYDQAAPWPEGLTGFSLVKRDPALDPARPESWRSSTQSGGSPGGVDSTGSFALWKIANSVVADGADVDADGLLPLVEYASGGSPATADSALLPTLQPAVPLPPGLEPGVVFSYLKKRGTDDVAAELRQSQDLSTWTTATATLEAITGLPGGMERIDLRVPITGPGQARLFLQLRWRTVP
jgi:CotH kinase protein/Lamin Tail Domain/Fn3 associated